MRTVVVTDPPRADTNDAEALGSSGVATVHEAQGRAGYLGPEFRPAWPGARIGGTAVTVLCWPGGNRIELCNAGARLVLAPDWQPIDWTEIDRAKGQAWGLKTIESFHTHGTPPVAETPAEEPE